MFSFVVSTDSTVTNLMNGFHFISWDAETATRLRHHQANGCQMCVLWCKIYIAFDFAHTSRVIRLVGRVTHPNLRQATLSMNNGHLI